MTGQISIGGTLSGSVSGAESLTGALSCAVYSPPLYEGEYTITPTEEEQTIEIKDHYANANITVGAIPTNYGRLTWNGTTLIVS